MSKRMSDEEIERVITLLDKHATKMEEHNVGETFTELFQTLGNGARAIRQLLEEKNALLAESASYTCKHLSTKKAGALWWLCEDCGAYFAAVPTSTPDGGQ